MENEEKVETKEPTEVDILKEKISQLEYELGHYKTNNEDLISKLAKADRKTAKANSYNEELRLQLDTLSKELHGYRKSQAVEKKVEVRDEVSRQEIGVQVNSDDFEIVFESKALPDWTETNIQNNPTIDTSSIADSLKATAEAVLHSQGSQPDSTTSYTSNYGDGYSTNQASSYVWDDNYQMYYDYNSGYFLDTANNLYYDPKTGTYFFYNNDTKKYEFHSQVSVNDSAEGSKERPTNSSNSARKSKSENHSRKSSSHLEKDTREVRHRDSPKKKERSKHKKQKRSRSGSRERDQSSKKRKKSKSRKRKKESKEENEEKGKHDSSRRGSHRSRKSKKKEKAADCERKSCEKISDEEEQDEFQIKEKENENNILEIPSTELESMDTDVEIEKQTSNDNLETANLDNKVPESMDCENSSTDTKINLKSKNPESSQSVVKDSSADQDVKLESVETDVKMEVSEDESISVGTGESELESGELSSDSSDSDPDSDFDEDPPDDDNVQEADMIVPEAVRVVQKDIHGQFIPYCEDDLRQPGNEASASWPPCIRVMVNQSECLDIGDLFIVTCTGGTIGREKGKNHVMEINDLNISRNHCSLRFDYTNNQYVVKDDGSQHGTFINDIRLSQAHEESTERGITHGDILKLGTTELLLHIHPGTDTCTDCEPGEVKARVRLEQGHNYIVMTAEEKKKQQKLQLKSIKKRYGLKNMNYEDNEAINNPAYEDKAATRRKKVGSDGPGHKSEAPASVHKPISQKNKGHKLLAKMGWKEGEGLGKSGSGITDPINATFRANQSAGFGSSSSVATSIDNVDGSATKKATIWKQTRERFDKISKQPLDIFKSDSDVEKPPENG